MKLVQLGSLWIFCSLHPPDCPAAIFLCSPLDQDSIWATSPFPNLHFGSSLQHWASPSWEQCPCSAVVCVLLSCYYKEKELCMELTALSSSASSRRTSVCHLAADFSPGHSRNWKEPQSSWHHTQNMIYGCQIKCCFLPGQRTVGWQRVSKAQAPLGFQLWVGHSLVTPNLPIIAASTTSVLMSPDTWE